MIVIVSIIRVNSHVATLDFRNTFQIVSSQRQKGKAKKKLSSDPTQLNPNERNTHCRPHHRFVLLILNSLGPKGWEDAPSLNQGEDREEELDPGIWPRMQIESL